MFIYEWIKSSNGPDLTFTKMQPFYLMHALYPASKLCFVYAADPMRTSRHQCKLYMTINLESIHDQTPSIVKKIPMQVQMHCT